MSGGGIGGGGELSPLQAAAAAAAAEKEQRQHDSPAFDYTVGEGGSGGADPSALSTAAVLDEGAGVGAGGDEFDLSQVSCCWVLSFRRRKQCGKGV